MWRCAPAAYGLPGVTIDGNDVLAVHEAARAAVDRARRGEGPTLLECKTYRWYFHAMRNAPPPETRPAAEIAQWKERDPIARLAADLIAQRLLTESDLGGLQRQVHADLREAVAFADASPFPDPKDILVDMFAPPTEQIPVYRDDPVIAAAGLASPRGCLRARDGWAMSGNRRSNCERSASLRRSTKRSPKRCGATSG